MFAVCPRCRKHDPNLDLKSGARGQKLDTGPLVLACWAGFSIHFDQNEHTRIAWVDALELLLEDLQPDLANPAPYMPAGASTDSAQWPLICCPPHPDTSNVDHQINAIHARQSYDTNCVNSTV